MRKIGFYPLCPINKISKILALINITSTWNTYSIRVKDIKKSITWKLIH